MRMASKEFTERALWDPCIDLKTTVHILERGKQEASGDGHGMYFLDEIFKLLYMLIFNMLLTIHILAIGT